MIVDATGDADVLSRAGARAEGENWMVYWAFISSLADMKKAVDEGDILKALDLHWWGRIPEPEDMASTLSYRAHNAREITDFVLEGRRMVYEELAGKSPNEMTVLAFPGMPQLRTTRRIEGEYLLTENDINTHFDDSIGSVCDWRKPGPVYEIPYRSLICAAVPNIIAAGRIISSTGDAWEITRVIPPSALTGQAAGLAAALAVRDDCALNDISIPKLQACLAEDGVLIHF
jgi:hypothetical protein